MLSQIVKEFVPYSLIVALAVLQRNERSAIKRIIEVGGSALIDPPLANSVKDVTRIAVVPIKESSVGKHRSHGWISFWAKASRYA